MLIATPPTGAQQRLPTGQPPSRQQAVGKAVGIKNVIIGLGDPSSGHKLQFSQADDGTVTAKLDQPARPGSRITLRAVANRVVAAQPVGPDAAVRLPGAAFEEAQTVCLEPPGSEPICGDLEPAMTVNVVKGFSNIKTATNVRATPQPCPPGQRPPCTPVQNPGAPIGAGPVAAKAVGVKAIVIGLGKVPSDEMLQFSQAEGGTVAGRVAPPDQPGSRMVFRDASNRIVAAGVIQRDGTFQTAALSVPLLQVATACRESRGAAPVCSASGELGKAIHKAGGEGSGL